MGLDATKPAFKITDKVRFKVRKRAKFRNRYNQAPQLTQDVNLNQPAQLQKLA